MTVPSMLAGFAEMSAISSGARARRRSSANVSDQDRVAQSTLQLRRRAFGDDLAVVEHDELFAESVGLFEVLGREQHRRPTFDQPFDDGPEVLSALGVEPGRRFVEEEDRGIGHQRRRQVEAPPHATGVGLDVLVRESASPKSHEQFARAPIAVDFSM